MTLRRLPSVDRVLGDPASEALVDAWGRRTVKLAVGALQDEARQGGEAPSWALRPDRYAEPAQAWLQREVGHGYRPVFNLTGTIVHSNLGRAPLAPALTEAALTAATRPTTLEYDLAAGKRGDREGIVAHRLRLLTGAEHATVVNNNAAAVLLMLNTLALGRAVPVSRGELVEIGGSFRLPEVMERAGCRLREVGATNRTHAADYERAIDDAALLLKVQPSNYRVRGFARAVPMRELAAIAHRRGLPACVDAGSGALVDLSRFGLPREPTPRQWLEDGADLVAFSGDKLLGGAQAGIVVGRRDLVDRLNANPLKRALRLDKIALALLDATLKVYEDETAAVETIPLLRTLRLPLKELERRAAAVAETLGDALRDVAAASVAVAPSRAQLGSGALPETTIPSRAVTVVFANAGQLRGFAAKLRACRPAVIGRVAEGRLWLDMRCAEPLDELQAALRGAS